jgi:hypothetical protein
MRNMAVKISQQPKLRNPCLIVGWPDVGYVGIKAVSYLKEKLAATEFADIELYDFSLMPQSLVKEGVLEALEFPRSEFSYWINERSEQDLIIFRSDLPAFRQHELVNLILDLAQQFGVKRVYTVGGLYARVHHTAIRRVLAVINNAELNTFVQQHDVEPGLDYHGPASMNGLLIGVAKERGVEGISLWGQVPNYLGEVPNPGIAQAVLKVLTQMLAVDIDFGEIEAESRDAEERIEKMITYFRGQHPELDDYLERLEQGMAPEFTEEESRRLFGEIEEFLKRGEQSE